jgi:predicted metal-dependent HD superfamily phosphohydrolase
MTPLEATWLDLCERLGVESDRRHPVWQVLVSAYSEPHRHYHTLVHIKAVVGHAERLHEHFQMPDTVLLALFFHDVIYDAARQDNEVLSAGLMRELLPDIDTSNARAMIEATKHHTATSDPDTNLLLDIDMSILGADWPAYRAYAEGVYREYLPVYGHDAYAAGRVALFLQPTLARDAIFLTPEFSGRETAARDNLHREIALWQAGGFAHA